ncbi:MAG: type 11 methyltransferase [Candidatus Saganbacteria bacterium]|uniref:Type 11 methyltransferase n=1 Tax=Candidatus Saganbacteria bacterium TaxID=2575572 RepID=A0A833L1W5_UNCSA|nr:MAG: type 11 methyltransferase [Candidatus Saganbacteria bacterium]
MKQEKTKVQVQPVLKLYLDLSKTNYLHFGLWKDGDELNLKNFQAAQERYIEHLISLIPKNIKTILDVGCGVGGNAAKLKSLGYDVSGICPDPYQEQLFKKNTDAKFYLSTIEDFNTEDKYDMILMSESVQYINPDAALIKAQKLLKTGGYLLASDYFKNEEAKNIPNLPSFPLSEYKDAIKRNSFSIEKEVEITKNILPTLKYGSQVYYDYIKPTLNCILTTLEVHLKPIHFLVEMFFKFKIGGKSIKQIIKNNIAPLPAETFEKYLTYRALLLKKIS